MGFFADLFTNKQEVTNVRIPAIMPEGAIEQIHRGILPTMRTDNIILSKGECCHFAERAIMVTEKVQKRTEGRSNGVSIRIAKGVTWRTGRYSGTPVEEVTIEKNKGLLYVTNKRVIFVSDKNAFDKKYRYLTACVPYTDGVKLQFGKNTYTLLVPDGEAVNKVIVMANNL